MAYALFYSAGNRLDQIDKKMKLVKWALGGKNVLEGDDIQDNLNVC